MTTAAAELIKHFEGCVLKSYPDPATHGPPWTIGYGCTGLGIKQGTVWTQEQADAALEHRLSALESVVRSWCPAANSNQMAALCSLGWNIGTEHLAKSEVIRYLKVGMVSAAANAFMHWERAGGKPHFLQGRRTVERLVFLGFSFSEALAAAHSLRFKI